MVLLLLRCLAGIMTPLMACTQLSLVCRACCMAAREPPGIAMLPLLLLLPPPALLLLLQ